MNLTVYSIDGVTPVVDPTAFVHPSAVLIGESAFVAAMALVKAGTVVAPRTLVAGIPAKTMRELTAQELQWKVEGTLSYQQLTRRCLATMQATAPLAAPEPNRRHFKLDEVIRLHVYEERHG